MATKDDVEASLKIDLEFRAKNFNENTLKASRNVQALTSTLQSYSASALTSARATNEFNRSLREIKQNTIPKSLRSDADTVKVGFSQATTKVRKFNSELRKTSSQNKKLDALNTRLKRTSTELSKVNSSAKTAGASVNRFGGLAQTALGYIGGRELLNNALAFDRINNRMKAATESQAEYTSATIKASRLSQELGVDLLSASRGYSTLIAATRGSGIEGAETTKLFESILKTSAALSLTADETNSVILAFSQVTSKGRAAAEEIRGQIGERIPGYFLKLADAIGVSTQELSKMLEMGELTSDTALRASAEALEKAFGEAAQNNAESLTARVNRLTNSIKELGKTLTSTGGALSSFIGVAAEGVEGLNRFIDAPQIAQDLNDYNNSLLEATRNEIGLLAVRRKNNEITAESFRALSELAINKLNAKTAREGVNILGGVSFNDGVEEFNKLLSDGLGLNRLIAITEAKINSQRRESARNQEKINQSSKDALQSSIILGDGLFGAYKSASSAVSELFDFRDSINDQANVKVAEQQRSKLEQTLKLQEARNSVLKDEKKSLLDQKKIIQDTMNIRRKSFIGAIEKGSAQDLKLSIQGSAGVTDDGIDVQRDQLDALEQIDKKLDALKNITKV